MTMEAWTQLSGPLRRLVTAIADTGDAAFVVSLDCQFLAWNWRAQQLFGYAPTEILGRYCYDVFRGRDASGQGICCVNCPMVTAARLGYSTPPTETQVFAKCNRPIWVRVDPIVLHRSQELVSAVLVLATDVSRYKLTEQIMRLIATCLVNSGPTSPMPAIDDVAATLCMCFPTLTRREADVLWLVIIGEDYSHIATILNIHPTTARNHIQHILARLDVHSQRQAVLKAMLALATLASPQGI